MAHYAPGYEGIKVLGARVVIKVEETSNTRPSGLIIMQDNAEPKYQGIVVATGEGARLENGTRMPMDISVGDNAIYSRMAGVPIEWGGESLLVINERDVIAVIS